MSLIKGQNRSWYSRGYLPHFDQSLVIQGITFRLADSLPAHVVNQLQSTAEIDNDARKRARAEEFMNAGHGACYLQIAEIACLVEDALLNFDGKRYRLMAWVVMPNHVHVLAEQMEGSPLAEVIHSRKSYTAHKANKLLGRAGIFWARDYFDRYIRDQNHLARAIDYIHYNPVKAGLVANPEEWRFSSAKLWQPSSGSPAPRRPSADNSDSNGPPASRRPMTD